MIKLTEVEYTKNLEELETLKVSLDKDPVAQGLSAINEKIADIQAKKDRVSNLLVEALANKCEYEKKYDTTKTSLDLERSKEIVTDTDIKNLKSDSARQAAANVKLNQKCLDNHADLLEFMTAESYLKCIYQIYNNLCSAQENLSRQISVIQMGINIGEIRREDLAPLMPRYAKVKEPTGVEVKLKTKEENEWNS